MKGVVVAVGVAAVALTACFGSDPNVTESGLGRPRVDVTFPDVAQPGSVRTATIGVTNPGPGDMSRVVISFPLIGAPGADLPTPIILPGVRGEADAVVDIDPEPRAVSDDAVTYVFGALAEGNSMTIKFDLRLPKDPGVAANAVIVSDGQDPERAKGERLATVVKR